MEEYKSIRIEVPPEAAQILKVLHEHGYEAYVVGGCVRDALLGRVPGDWDITTSALPQEVKAYFPHTVDTGIQHGTVMVLMNGCGFEVTTFRIDGAYEDGRHPLSVTFTRSLEEDLKRRDFTINAFAWGDEGLIDLFDGLKDLEDGVIRCVGDPDCRFDEDALRIMRAVRFSAQLGFTIEKKTEAMIQKHAPRLKDISMERIRVEWEKTLLSDHPTYVALYADYGIAPFIIRPGAQRCFSHDADDLLEELNLRRKAAMSGASAESVENGLDGWCDGEMYRVLMMAAFLGNLTAEEANEALRFLRYDNKTRERVVKVLKYRDTSVELDRAGIKRAMNCMGQEIWIAVLELKTAQAAVGRTGPAADVDGQERLKEVIDLTRDVIASGEPWMLSQLAVNGSDLIKAGIPAGKKLGEILENILQKVMQSPTLNKKDILCGYATELFKKD